MNLPASSSGTEPETKLVDRRLAKRFWIFIRPHQRLVWAGLGLLLSASLLSLAKPFLVMRAIDQHMVPGRMEGFYPLAGIFLAVAVLEFFLRRRQMYTVDLAGQKALLDLRVQLFRHLQRLSSSFYDRTPIGRLVGRVTTDVQALQELFSSGVVTILGDLFFLTATFGILLYLNWQLTLVCMVMAPFFLFTSIWIRNRVRGAYSRMRERISQLNTFLHEQISGMPLIQMFLQEEATEKSFRTINDDVRDSQLQTVWWESTLSAAMEMLGSFTLALILWYGGSRITGTDLSGEGASLTLGSLFAFINYMQKFFQPLNDLSMKYTVMQNATIAGRRIFDLLDQEDWIDQRQATDTLPEARGEIRFENVHFSYQHGDPVLQGVSFHVRPGEKVAVVGATGAGKTTLLKLLTRLYDVNQGRIVLDGQDVRHYPLENLRKRVGVVPQEVFLFEGDILSNIRLGKPEISEEAALQAASQMGLDSFVQRFPHGYREPVQERGKNLSSGERQLLAFARVMALAPQVLVLDEATANVDTQTEDLIQSALQALWHGRTALIIAHRLSTIQDADRILVLHQGKLVEEGNHRQLMARRGTYWRLHQLQFEGSL
ncbi:MAG: ABC transporter ATP-binding protein [Planctomycetota bacterium]|nr:MAG: ABC transporter ATP-binding protein [Planctomycetota bacterium]